MIAVLGIDHLDKAREEHLDSILVWHDSLGRWMSSTDVPFPASATPAPAPAPFDFQAFLAEIDAEMARRKISDTVAESLAARAMDLAEKKNKIITTVLDAVKAYPLKVAISSG